MKSFCYSGLGLVSNEGMTDVTLNNKLVLSRKKVILFKLNGKIIKTKPEGQILLY